MNWKRYWKKIIVIAIAVALVFWFFVPVSVVRHFPETEDIYVHVTPRHNSASSYGTYLFVSGSEAHAALRSLLQKYPCYRMLPLGLSYSVSGPRLDQTLLFSLRNPNVWFYTVQTRLMELNGTWLKLGLLGQKQAQTFHAEMAQFLKSHSECLISE